MNLPTYSVGARKISIINIRTIYVSSVNNVFMSSRKTMLVIIIKNINYVFRVFKIIKMKTKHVCNYRHSIY